jgi:pyruvate dehydrogenase E2 component (dihydrolipoamide acetyltransferase)
MGTKITLPEIGEGIDQVEISEVSINIGDTVNADDVGLIVETEKASMEIPVSTSGIVKEILIKNGELISPGTEIFIIKKSDVNVEEAKHTQVKKEKKSEIPKELISRGGGIPSLLPQVKPPKSIKSISASPSIRRYARELGCDLGQVSGTGLKGRINKDDVQEYIKFKLNQAKSISSHNTINLPSIDFGQFGEIETQPLNKIRRISGKRLQTAWNTIPHVTQFDKADITNLEKLRKLLNNAKSEPSPKMSYLPFIMKAAVYALKEFPDFNSSLDSTGTLLILKKYFNIGIAVDTPNGLMVPVIRNVDQKSVPEIVKELADISERSRIKRIKPDELTGGCFTISSLGGISGTGFTPIINPPEVAILGISRTTWEPVYDGQNFNPQLTLPLSLSYDHRVIDGAIAARFTKLLSSLLGEFNTIPGLDIY